jgi:hypothetical protein
MKTNRPQLKMFEFQKELHSIILEQAGLPLYALEGNGYDLKKSVPVYAWQLLEILEKLEKADFKSYTTDEETALG